MPNPGSGETHLLQEWQMTGIPFQPTWSTHPHSTHLNPTQIVTGRTLPSPSPNRTDSLASLPITISLVRTRPTGLCSVCCRLSPARTQPSLVMSHCILRGRLRGTAGRGAANQRSRTRRMRPDEATIVVTSADATAVEHETSGGRPPASAG